MGDEIVGDLTVNTHSQAQLSGVGDRNNTTKELRSVRLFLSPHYSMLLLLNLCNEYTSKTSAMHFI